jgi:cytochrome c biogenesis protein ResB
MTVNFLASPRLLYWLLPAIAILSAGGTLMPQGEAPDIYHSRLFITLLGLLGLNLSLCTFRQVRVRLRLDVLLTHLGILMILTGAMVTGIRGKHGSLPLLAGVPKDTVEGRRDFRLPFSVMLENFRIETYGPSRGPIKQFRSKVAIIENNRIVSRQSIEVNAPLRWKGYTLYQAGYDPENAGFSNLLVSSDPGVPVVYTGFLLLTAGLAGSFLRGLRKQI